MEICKRLDAAKNDEADGILEYVKLKELLAPKYEAHAETIESIIADEHEHALEVLAIIEDIGCVELTPIQKVCMISKGIYENANKIEKLSAHIDNREDSIRIKQIAEEFEKLTKEIKTIAKK